MPKKKKKKEMTKEEFYKEFIEIMGLLYDDLWRFWHGRTYKRVTMDRTSYLKEAERYFEDYYQMNLVGVTLIEDTLTTLIKKFQKDVEFVELTSQV